MDGRLIHRHKADSWQIALCTKPKKSVQNPWEFVMLSQGSFDRGDPSRTLGFMF